MTTRRHPRRVPPDPIYAEVGKLLTDARGNIPQETLAARVGISRQALSVYEAGRSAIPLRRLVELAAVLRIDPADLIPEPAADVAPIPYELTASASDMTALRRLAGQSPRSSRR